MSVFEFVYSDQEFIDKVLRDYGEQITPELRKVLNDYGNNRQANDDDLTGFLNQQSFAPGIGVSLSTNTAITTGTPTALAFETQEFASTEVITWDGASKLTVGEAGVLLVSVYVQWNLSAAGAYRQSFLKQNSSYLAGANNGPLGGTAGPLNSVTTGGLAVAGDEFSVEVAHDVGSDLQVLEARFTAFWLGASG